METMNTNAITIEALVSAPIEKVWKYWTEPKHIMAWSFASDDWHAPHAENDLKVGGKFTTTMAAKDGSFSFDFGGIYTAIKPQELIEYVLEDGRKVQVIFKSQNSKTNIISTFDPESQNPLDMQKNGWQAILDNFKKHCETA